MDQEGYIMNSQPEDQPEFPADEHIAEANMVGTTKKVQVHDLKGKCKAPDPERAAARTARKTVKERDDLAIISQGIAKHALLDIKCAGCGTTYGLVFDERFSRHVCPVCLIKERDYILRRLAESVVGPKNCSHKLLEYDHSKLNQTAIVEGICTVCNQKAETPC